MAWIYPSKGVLAHLSVLSYSYRHTVNRRVMAAIAHALENVGNSNAHILTDNIFYIQMISRAITCLQSLNYHIHETLARHIASLLSARDGLGLHTEIGEVQAHGGIEYNETADSMANEVVAKSLPPPETYMTGGYETLGRHTWPIRTTNQTPVANLRTWIQMPIPRQQTLHAIAPPTKHGNLI